jgi:hypothetical protein
MWIAILKDGSEVTEKTHKWSQIKDGINRLSYIYNGTRLDLPPSTEFIQYKSASASLFGGNIEIESQTIGFILNGKKILFRFYFKINKIETIVE